MKKIITSPHAPAPIGPYNQAILHGDTLYISGQIAINAATGALENANLEQETHRVMKNLEAILKEAGMGFKDVIKCTIFMRDLQDYGQINTIYGSYFDEETAPARAAIQVAGLPKNVRVEISAIAGK